jgi:hypothetical protein
MKRKKEVNDENRWPKKCTLKNSLRPKLDHKIQTLKSPHWEGLGRLEAEPTKKQFHWYEKQSIDLSRLH